MAGNTFAANAFAQNFMTGFSFVDEIKRQKKADQRLEVRLKEEREERSFQRKRQVASDERIDTLFGQQQEDRVDDLEEERLREEGDQFALQNPDATPEELAQFAPYSPEAAAALRRQNEQNRISGALNTVTGPNGIPQAGQTGSQSPRSLSEAVTNQTGNAAGLPTMNPQEREAEAQLRAEAEGRAPSQATSPEPPGFQFAGDQGTAGMERVSEEEFNRFNKEYQNKGFFGKVGDVAVGQGSQTVRAAEDVVGAIFNAPSRMAAEIFGAERVTPLPSQNTGQEFTGELNLPAEFTTPEEFEQMAVDGASPAATQEAADRNFAITEDYVRRGRNVSRDMDIGAFTRQGAALATSDEERRNAIAMEQRAVKTAQEFLDPATQAESELGQLAMEDPRAATVKYLEMRATLENTNPTLANETDRAMLPVVKMSEEQFQAETASLDPESRDGKKALASLSNLQRSRDAIAKGQPSINEQSNIKPAGVKVGDAERVTDVVDTIFDPDRVVPTQNTGSAINTAATVAGRISPSKRINAAQTDALATLAQAGWIDKTTAMSVMMTGHWPPGKNPNGIRKIQEAGGTVYAMTNNDDVIVLQSAKGALPPPAPSTAITDEQVGWVAASIKRQFPNMEDNNVQALTSIMYENPEWVRSRWNNTSQEDMRKLGTFIAETKVLTDNKYTQMADGWFWFEGNTKEAPTVNQTLMDVAMRDRLNVEFGMDYKPMPDLKEMSGLDAEQARQNLEQGRSGREAQINARQYSDDEAIEAYARGVYTELDQAGRLELVNGEWVVLPESEAP